MVDFFYGNLKTKGMYFSFQQRVICALRGLYLKETSSRSTTPHSQTHTSTLQIDCELNVILFPSIFFFYLVFKKIIEGQIKLNYYGMSNLKDKGETYDNLKICTKKIVWSLHSPICLFQIHLFFYFNLDLELYFFLFVLVIGL